MDEMMMLEKKMKSYIFVCLYSNSFFHCTEVAETSTCSSATQEKPYIPLAPAAWINLWLVSNSPLGKLWWWFKQESWRLLAGESTDHQRGHNALFSI